MPITFFDGDYYMSSNGLYCGINAPPAKTSSSGRELPPYAKCQAFLADDYLRIPKNWMESSGRTASYFVGVPKNHGLWIDLNKNNRHTHEVAVVISIQGINPITGLPCVDPQLEQYIDDCPKCKSKFKANRYCESCGYHWPKQNYISSNAQPNGAFWLDGFRSAEGIIRQWIFSEEEKKGVAANVIGGDRVYAIGLSFFLSKEKKAQPVAQFTRSISHGFGHVASPASAAFWNGDKAAYTTISASNNSSGSGCSDNTMNFMSLDVSKGTKSLKSKPRSKGEKCGKKSAGGGSSIESCQMNSGGGSSADSDTMSFCESPAVTPVAAAAPAASICENYACDTINIMSEAEARAKRPGFYPSAEEIDRVRQQLAQTANDPNLIISCGCGFDTRSVEVTKLEMAAGNEIDQAIYNDPESLDFWRNEPEAIIVINYAFDEEVKEIVKGGKKLKKTNKEGFLTGIPVGN